MLVATRWICIARESILSSSLPTPPPSSNLWTKAWSAPSRLYTRNPLQHIVDAMDIDKNFTLKGYLHNITISTGLSVIQAALNEMKQEEAIAIVCPRLQWLLTWINSVWSCRQVCETGKNTWWRFWRHHSRWGQQPNRCPLWTPNRGGCWS